MAVDYEDQSTAVNSREMTRIASDALHMAFTELGFSDPDHYKYTLVSTLDTIALNAIKKYVERHKKVTNRYKCRIVGIQAIKNYLRRNPSFLKLKTETLVFKVRAAGIRDSSGIAHCTGIS